MEKNYQYFNRDISWLSFNYRVLLEADDDRLPLYDRINFIAIYSSNLEEFYRIRVAEHMSVVSGEHSDEETPREALRIIHGFYSVFKAVIFSPLAARVRRARGESPKEALQKCAKCDKESNP